MSTVLVTDGDQRSALAVVRSLGRAGYRVVVGDSHVPSLASRSRFCRAATAYPSPYRGEEAFVRGILDAVATHGVDLIIPMTDISSAILASRRESLPEDVRLATTDAETFWRASDKISLHHLAVGLGVPSPTTHVLEPPLGPTALGVVQFPCIVKPARSRLKTPSGWIATGVRTVDSRVDLDRLLAAAPELQFPFMIQRRVDGEGIGVFALCDHGDVGMLFAHRRIREKPPWGGVSVLRESTAVDPVAGAHARSLLKALKWHGVAMVEFKRDRQTGVPESMEINGRFWGSLQLAIDSGLDFPLSLARLFAGESLSPQTSYRLGIRSRWLLGDLDHLLIRLRHPRLAIPGAPSLVAAVWDFCKFLRRDTYYEVESLSDPGPSLYELGRYARDAFKPA